jgi:hypothetical protein
LLPPRWRFSASCPDFGKWKVYYIDNTGGELIGKSPLAIAEVASNRVLLAQGAF